MRKDNKGWTPSNETPRLRMAEGAQSLFADDERKRFSLNRDARNTVIMGVSMLAVFVLSVLFTFNLLHPNFSAAWVSQMVIRRMRDIVDLFSGNRLQSGIHFFLCQFVTPMIAGVALGASGACFQGVFRNPIASPTMLGVEAGGSLGATIYALFFYVPPLAMLLRTSYEGYAIELGAMTAWQKYGQYFFVLIGCVVVTMIVMSLLNASGRGRVGMTPMIVGGMVFTGTITSMISMAQFYVMASGGSPMITETVRALQLGTFQNISSPALLLMFSVLVLVPFTAMLVFSARLNVIVLGDQEARVMGVSINRDRYILVMLSALMTAAVVAFCGSINFVGLVVPHFARMASGNDFRRLVPASAFLGGIFMLLAHVLSYMLNGMLNAGSIVSIVGAVVFFVFMTRYRRKGNADWS